MDISIGLVGLGSFGSAFAPLFKSHPLVSRIALCDREPERIKKFADDPFFKDKFNPRDTFDSHPYLVHEFVDALAKGRQPAINIWEAARYMAMGVMAHKSALKDGATLSVPDWGDAP